MQSEIISQNSFDELLTESVKNFPIIYETSGSGNKNKQFRDNAWKMIADALKSSGKFAF